MCEVVEAMMMNESTRLLAAEEDRDSWSGKPCPAGAEGARGSSCRRVKVPGQSVRAGQALVSTLLLFLHSTQALHTPALPTSVLDVLHLRSWNGGAFDPPPAL